MNIRDHFSLPLNIAPPARPSSAAAQPVTAFSLREAWPYFLTALVISLAQGFGLNFITANITQIQGSFGVTTNEANWLIAAYMAPNVSLSVLMVKVRNQFGLRNFAEIAIVVFVAVSGVHLFVNDFNTALMLRFFAGVVGSCLSSLGILYMFDPFPPKQKMTIGICLALATQAIAAPLTRVISTSLLDLGGWHGLYLLEAALALMAFALVYCVPLRPMVRTMTLEWLDLVSYSFVAIGLGCLAVVLCLGRLYWWLEAPWLGVLLAIAIGCMAVVVAIELNRKTPLLDIQWIASRKILHFVGVLLIFRLALAEQASGAQALMVQLGMAPEQMQFMWLVVLVVAVAFGLGCALIMQPGREHAIHAVSLMLIGFGCYISAFYTNLVRPEQLILGQAMVAAGGALFLPPAMSAGFRAALARGPNNILSFILVFIFTQSTGGLLGSAVLGTFVTLREKFHSSVLVDHLDKTDPLVIQRITQLSASYGKVITDAAVLKAEGSQLLAAEVTREAWVMAYNDLFYLVFVLCFVALAALLAHWLYLTVRAQKPAAV